MYKQYLPLHHTDINIAAQPRTICTQDFPFFLFGWVISFYGNVRRGESWAGYHDITLFKVWLPKNRDICWISSRGPSKKPIKVTESKDTNVLWMCASQLYCIWLTSTYIYLGEAKSKSSTILQTKKPQSQTPDVAGNIQFTRATDVKYMLWST